MSGSFSMWLALALAIVCETIATSFLKASDQFTHLWPSVATVTFYAASFWLLTVALKAIPVGVAYAIWSGVGIVLISLIGRFVFGQVLDWAAIVGIGLILTGVVVINLLSSSASH